MTFDEKLKARAEREGSPTPEGFDDRIANRLQSLPAPERPTRRLPLRRAVVVGIAAALCLAGAAAAPTVISMARGAINYFDSERHTAYGSQQDKFEAYNAAVGLSQKNGERTLTIDNIAVDDSYLNVFYTLTSETPLALPSTDATPAEIRVSLSAPHFWAVIDGKKLEPTGTIESEAYAVNDRTLKGMERIALTRALPDEFELLLYTGGTDAIKDAEFQFSLAVDKSAVAVESLSVEPKIDFTLDFTTWFGDPPERYDFHHEVRIERVSISPFGSTLTLSEKADDPLTAFVLRDDQGKYLPVLPSGTIGSGIYRVSNVFEFLGADTDTKSITLIPIGAESHSHAVEGALDALPLTDDTEGGVTLETLQIGPDKAVATFSTEGAMFLFPQQFTLTDENGKYLSFHGDTYLDSTIDRETGLITSTLYYPQATAEDLAKVHGVTFWQDDPLTLLEDQAVTIDLQ
ncbi:DUF4179 domain-containing protein [Butyricicoccus faecihominis]|uniref:DUF4179 domain-containing protein n=1 Tax=Butyricicoccus faecihominis TaxID=1712515 RepID=UPI00247871B8|nr:DUF4179 domain-containing protein [Butyricicoccus faecihominis]MCQ5131115.1 DUF4179 domain-containing protein [Butyricicoccus faecihominis]